MFFPGGGYIDAPYGARFHWVKLPTGDGQLQYKPILHSQLAEDVSWLFSDVRGNSLRTAITAGYEY